VSVETDVFLTI